MLTEAISQSPVTRPPISRHHPLRHPPVVDMPEVVLEDVYCYLPGFKRGRQTGRYPSLGPTAVQPVNHRELRSSELSRPHRSLSDSAIYRLLRIRDAPLNSIPFARENRIKLEYTAPVVSLGAVFAIAVAMDNPYVHRHSALMSPFQFTMGLPYLNRETFLLEGPLPWLQAAKYALVALLLLIISVEVIIERCWVRERQGSRG
jgi:hypothetical protein